MYDIREAGSLFLFKCKKRGGRVMNIVAAKAEMAVRSCRWGEGLGGVSLEEREFVDITSQDFLNYFRDLTKKQVENRRRIVEKMRIR